MFYRLDQFRSSFIERNGSIETEVTAPTRAQTITLILLLLLTIFTSLWDFQSFQLGTWYDDINYYILTRSLIESDQFGQINNPGEPSIARYPFGYPLVLSPVMALFPDSVDALKLFSLAATLANGVILVYAWHWFSQKSRWWAVAVAALYLLAPLTIEHTRMVMAESIFTTFFLLTIVAVEQAVQKKEGRFWPVGAGVYLTFVAFTRTIGLLLVPAFLGYLLLRRGFAFWKQIGLVLLTMGVVVTAVILLTPVQLNSGLFPERYWRGLDASFINTIRTAFLPNLDVEETFGERYIVEDDENEEARINHTTLLGDFLVGIKIHLRDDLRQAVIQIGGGDAERELAARIGLPWLPNAFGYFVGVLIFLGFGWHFWLTRQISFFNLAGVLYFAALLIWVWSGPRLLYPIMPQLFFGFLLGLELLLVLLVRITKQTKYETWAYRLLIVPVVILMGVHIAKDLTEPDSVYHVGDFQARTKWIVENTEPDVIVMTEDVFLDYVYSDRKTVYFPDVGSAAALDEYLLNNDVDYILLASRRQWFDNGYQPLYSPETNDMLGLLSELSDSGDVTLVHTADEYLVKVFRIENQ